MDPRTKRFTLKIPARITVVARAPELPLRADLVGLPFRAYLQEGGALSPGSVYGSGTESEIEIKGDKRPVILGHPPMYGRTVLRFHLTLPPTPAKLIFGTSLKYTQPSDGDGLRFLIVCNDKELWSRETRECGWVETSVSLSEFAGQTVLLDLVTDSITKNWHDHSGWAGLRISAR